MRLGGRGLRKEIEKRKCIPPTNRSHLEFNQLFDVRKRKGGLQIPIGPDLRIIDGDTQLDMCIAATVYVGYSYSCNVVIGMQTKCRIREILTNLARNDMVR